MGNTHGSCPQGRQHNMIMWRLCCYRQFNPIPSREDVFVKLDGGKLFTKLDLKSAYQQLPLDPDSQQYVTINTHHGLYRYKGLPFGIASSPAIFQRTMDIILQGLEHVASIQDDILITGKDYEEHITNLNLVLNHLDDHGLRLQLNKCRFMQKTVTYVGCVISAEGISPTEEKIEAIKQAPRPENTTQLRAFLGMVNYHGIFIPNLSTILQPLHQLLQKKIRNSPCPLSVRKHSVRQRNRLCLRTCWCIMTSTNPWSWNAVLASMASVQSYFTASKMKRRSLLPIRQDH